MQDPKVSKNRHLGTIPQLRQATSSQLRHVSTIGKKLVKQQYLLYMSSQYGELRPSSGWDSFVSLGHPCKFQLVSRLGSVTARRSSSGRQSNFAALNRGRHLCSAGRPPRWALAHILVHTDSSDGGTGKTCLGGGMYCPSASSCYLDPTGHTMKLMHVISTDHRL